MKRFVFWTGVIDAVLGAGFFVPGIAERMMPSAQPGFLQSMFAAVAVFLGIMLMFCSRDLAHRGVLVIWEGVLRCGSFVIGVVYVALEGGEPSVLMLGLFDLIVGAVYLAALPRHLGVPLSGLLLDRHPAA